MGLIKAFKDWYNEPEPAKPPVPQMPRPSRAVQTAPVVDKDFSLGQAIWLYISPQSNRLLLVNGLNDTAGEQLTDKQLNTLAKWGVCYQVHNFTSNHEYWRRPSESGIHERLSSHNMRSAAPMHFQLVMALRYKHEPLGMWCQVVMEEPVLPSSEDLIRHKIAPL